VAGLLANRIPADVVKNRPAYPGKQQPSRLQRSGA
jgi:hypothetical protein